MADKTCGLGYLDSNFDACASGWTYLDKSYPATGDFTCDTITFHQGYAFSADADFKIGIGTISGTTFTVTHVVTLSGTWSFGEHILTAPSDFTEFDVDEGDYLFFYAHGDSVCPSRTTSADPEGLGYAGGDKTGESSFTFSVGTIDTVEVQLSGPEIGAVVRRNMQTLIGIG